MIRWPSTSSVDVWMSPSAAITYWNRRPCFGLDLPTVCFMSFILRTLLWRINDDDDDDDDDFDTTTLKA